MKKSAIARAMVFSAALLAAAGAQAADEIKIGFLTTLSGPGAGTGQDIRDAFLLAIKMNGGKLGGLPVNISVTDDQNNPVAARQTVERYIKRDKVDVITGPVFSSVVLPILPTILQNDTVFLSTNTGPADYAGEKCDPNFFAVSWQNEDVPQAMGAFASSKGYKRVAMIAPNYPGGRESLQGFKRKYTGEIVDEVYTKMGQLDYSAEIANLKTAKPDAVFYFLPGGMGINFVKQYNASGLQKDAPLLTPGFTADTENIAALGKDLVGTYNSSQWAHDLPNEANKKFVEAYQKEYGRLPSMYSSQGYDAAMLLDGAVRQVNGKIEDHKAFLKALKDAKFDSVRGKFRFNNNQYPIHDIYMRQVVEDAQGNVQNKLVSKVLDNHRDPFANQCPMK
ncbi:ABC transporter substrate-binding protein [Pusillimonas sp. NJUB218]|uniref:ABC transporter substrate-binding protein n=1 Tax=Pusillimonas sp. NJUB218 TaxID=2023230 RepID=UPI000F4B1B8E|nr:ABC transporter substrate-binding protein [Pusillimonas sp. NJUB218]ROT46493.1 ABC transporter substrate-binding protein [Pusillimonas sp. NJUB218]